MKSPNLLRTNKINIAVDHILNDYRFFSTPQQYQEQDNFYVYDESNGVYVLNGEMHIVKMLEQIFGNSFKYYSHIRDVINEVQRLSPIIPNDQIDPPNIINYRNGILDKSTNKLYPHSPKFYTTKQIPQNYINESSSLTKQAQLLALLNFID
jgi:phage/plasmid-associated DNA primase